MQREEKNSISGIWKDKPMGKIKTLLFALTPGAAFILAQSVILLCFDSACLMIAMVLARLGGSPSGFLQVMAREGSYLVGIIGDGIFLILGFVWLRRQFLYAEKEKAPYPLGAQAMLFLLVSGAALQFATDVLLTLAQVFLPGLMDSYMQVMESLGMGAPTVCSLVYTVVFAPVAEELAFRGLTLGILLRGKFSFWTANAIQALLFALIHGNLVQGAYAFVAGLLFGCLLRRYGSLKAPVFCHFVVNLSGVLMGMLPFGFPGLAVSAVLLTAAALLLKYAEERK